MQYILTENEFKEYMKVSEYIKIRNSLLNDIDKLKTELMKGKECIHDSKFISYCDSCPLGYLNTNTCTKKQNYSK